MTLLVTHHKRADDTVDLWDWGWIVKLFGQQHAVNAVLDIFQQVATVLHYVQCRFHYNDRHIYTDSVFGKVL